MTVKPTLGQLRRFVGNPNAYAVQLDEGGYAPRRQPLDDKVLKAHLAQEITVGTYIVNVDVARTLVFDCDSENNETALEEAKSIGEALKTLEFPLYCTGIEDSGRRGYHVWVLLEDYRPAEELRRVGRAVCALAGVQTR